LMLISLSILEYERDLSQHVNNLAASLSFSQILRLVGTGKIHRVHLDIMRPPMIPGKRMFSIQLMRRLYEDLHKSIPLAFHLMVSEPLPILMEINEFVPKGERHGTAVFIQVESFTSQKKTAEALSLLRECGYEAGICLNLPTPSRALTREIVGKADTILLMSVPMGQGGQKYSSKATNRIKRISKKFPDKPIEVDGGMNAETVFLADQAGAKVAIVGSFITQNQNHEGALLELERSLKMRRVERA